MAALFVLGCKADDAKQISATSCAPDPGMTVTHGHVTGTEHAMSSILSIRPGGASTTPLNRHRSGDARTSAPTGQDDGALLLPRLLLVELAGVAADVTSLRERLDDDSQLHGPLDRIRGRLDDLVDSIYERAVDPAPRPVDASSGHGSAITADRPGTAEAVRSGTASTAS